MISEQTKADYAEMATRMLGKDAPNNIRGLLRRIHHIHELYGRNTAHMDLDIKTLLVAIVVEDSGLVRWGD